MNGFDDHQDAGAMPGVGDGALRKAADAGIHPSTPVTPSTPPPSPGPAVTAPLAPAPAPAPAPAVPIVGSPTVTRTKPAKRRKVYTTVTKSTRKALKAQARQRGLSLADYLASVLEATADQGTGSSAS